VTVDGKPQPTWGAAMILGTIVPAQRNVEMFQYVDQPYAEKLYNEMDRRRTKSVGGFRSAAAQGLTFSDRSDGN